MCVDLLQKAFVAMDIIKYTLLNIQSNASVRFKGVYADKRYEREMHTSIIYTILV